MGDAVEPPLTLSIDDLPKALEATEGQFTAWLKREGGDRYSTAAERRAFRDISSWAESCGVSRLAECTSLDRLGIPSFYAVRPAALHPAAIVSSGKGPTRSAAIMSALFESFERWASERLDGPVLEDDEESIRRRYPNVLTVKPPYVPSCTRWATGYEHRSRRACLVAVDAVLFPVLSGSTILARRDVIHTNGLAAGAQPMPAMLNGLLELIERDGFARSSPTRSKRIDPASLPDDLCHLYRRFDDCSVELAIYECCGLTTVPTFYAISRDRLLSVPHFQCFGAGAGLNARAACARALYEVAQSRVGIIAGVRDDVDEMASRFCEPRSRVLNEQLDAWFREPARPKFRDHSRTLFVPIESPMELLVEEIGEACDSSIVVSVALRSYPGLYAFRQICPALLGPSEVDESTWR